MNNERFQARWPIVLAGRAGGQQMPEMGQKVETPVADNAAEGNTARSGDAPGDGKGEPACRNVPMALLGFSRLTADVSSAE